MTSLVPLSNAVCRAVEQSFPPQDRQPVLNALAAVEGESVREAVVILAYGDRSKAEKLSETANFDFRDVVIQLDERCGGLPTTELVRRCRALGLSVPWPWSNTLPEKMEEDVKRFVASETITLYERIVRTTRLQEDLGVKGPEGISFMEIFAKRFAVDLRAFHPERHFDMRPGGNLITTLLALVLGRRKPHLASITISDLVAAVQSKQFISPTE